MRQICKVSYFGIVRSYTHLNAEYLKLVVFRIFEVALEFSAAVVTLDSSMPKTLGNLGIGKVI